MFFKGAVRIINRGFISSDITNDDRGNEKN